MANFVGKRLLAGHEFDNSLIPRKWSFQKKILTIVIPSAAAFCGGVEGPREYLWLPCRIKEFSEDTRDFENVFLLLSSKQALLNHSLKKDQKFLAVTSAIYSPTNPRNSPI